MSFTDWRDAARGLRQLDEPADAEQLELGATIGLAIDPELPARVVAALLDRHLAGPLRRGRDKPVSEGQAEFLADLVEDLGLDPAPAPDTYNIASAWLDVLVARRALAALEREQPRPGDLVRHRRKVHAVEEVSSIGPRGQIYVKGSGSPRIPAHSLVIVARARDDTPEGADARRRALNRREARRPAKPLSTAQLSRLEPYRVDGSPTEVEIELLERAIDSGPERPVQEVLERYPQLLAGLTQSSWGTFVIPQASFGGDKFPDFLLAVADSGGVHWTFVEIENPLAVKVGRKDGQLGDSARKPINQIDDWRDWLTEDRAFAVHNRGLAGIRPESPGLAIVGRRGDGPWPSELVRHRLAEQHTIRLHSYDWLLEALRHGAGVERPGGPLDWYDWRARV